jgi:MFS family permease
MQSLAPLVTALGVAQLVSWGTLFYAIAVLGPAMRQDLGASELFVFGAFTAGLLVSGTLAPFAGRLVDRRGGRYTLSIGSALAALSMAVLAAAVNSAMMVAGWLLVGAAMATCLYDPAFATLSQHTGPRYRKTVTVLTLFGALASTVFWPLSLLLVEAWGWRGAFATYAALHLLLCLPLHLAFVPRRAAGAHPAGAQAAAAGASPAIGTARLRWLTASFALSSFAFAVIAVHIVTLLTSAGLTAAQAVSLSMLVGPMQIVGRGAELLFAGRIRAVTVGLAAYGFVLVAILALVNVDGAGVAAVVFVIAYGCGNGIFTIVKGTAPAELFGREGLGAVLGHLARAGLYARALAPASFSGMLALGLGRNASLLGLGIVVLAALGSYALAIRPPSRSGDPARDA